MDSPDLNTIPSKAVNFSTRLLLGQFLNPEQPMLTREGFARDYRGLAEQMGFDCIDINNFRRNDNPTLKILESWSTQPNTTMGQLVQYLEKIGRYDIIQDLQSKFEFDAKLYCQKNVRNKSESPLQVPEISSCRQLDSNYDDSGILTREDANTGEYTFYDAFVCYADEDIHFVSQLVKMLESDKYGFKLFVRSRDMLAGHSEYETSMQLIQERCKRVLIILSPDFLRCPACEVQASFAAGLAIDERVRKLIPIVYKSCEIPLMLKFLSKIDFTKPAGVNEWIWARLVSSLQDGQSSSFISLDGGNFPAACQSLPQLDSPDLDNPAITFPPTNSLSVATCDSLPSPFIVQESTSHSTVSLIKTSTKQKSKLQNLRFWKLPKKTDSSHGHDYSSSMSPSNATSGFHSHSTLDDSVENFVDARKPFSQYNATEK